MKYDFVVVGGGIVGLSTAMALVESPGPSLAVMEAEDRLGAHQSGNNSGVIHSGLYYKPGSLKARNCVEGRRELYRFCREQGIPHEQCGKIVVAATEEELPVLDELERRGLANGLIGIRRLSVSELREREPHVQGVDGLFVPETGIVDFPMVVEAYAGKVRTAGGEILVGTRLTGCFREGGGLRLETTRGEMRCRYLVNCAGLQSDRVARMCGLKPSVRIVPFRGEYYELKPEAADLVKHLIYPVHDPRFPFLGVHFTRMVGGGVEAGPNAVLAFKREGYRWWSFSLGDTLDFLRYPGFWRMAARYGGTGLGEMYRSFSKAAFVRSLKKLVPDLSPDDVVRGGAGVRAQAIDQTGRLVDDFHIEEREDMIHVLNAPSPAATASISIGRTIAERAIQGFTHA